MGDASIHFLRSGNIADKKGMLETKQQVQPTQPVSEGLCEVAMRNSSLAEKKKMFDESVKKHNKKMANNPFSASFKAGPPRLSKDDPNYGRPVAGSKSEMRGKKAARHINAEVMLLCDMIYQEGQQFENGTAVISFGDLFQIYTRISNKVVGMLLRARKYGLVDFEGEMLFQRRDDDVPILLTRSIGSIRDEMNEDKEFDVGICHQTNKTEAN
ncbi:actin-binding Rho-activating protein-like isoform X2 [Penaeus japonicus]|uniref:actin-binding Rho-activating protein-like isoform X2 n=1 Tax=Penaeus japonicus TaxID=27405 RepID=UPI001C7135B9|nr:actin-binding Rho-activating protein-like isoform X2 [Penaeus japonicus]